MFICRPKSGQTRDTNTDIGTITNTSFLAKRERPLQLANGLFIYLCIYLAKSNFLLWIGNYISGKQQIKKK